MVPALRVGFQVERPRSRRARIRFQRDADLRRAFLKLDADCSLTAEGARFRRMVFGRHLLQVTRYIHRNPVDAGLVPRPGDWRWSSYAGYVNSLEAPPWLRSTAVLGCLGSIGARHRYRVLVEN